MAEISNNPAVVEWCNGNCSCSKEERPEVIWAQPESTIATWSSWSLATRPGNVLAARTGATEAGGCAGTRL